MPALFEARTSLSLAARPAAKKGALIGLLVAAALASPASAAPEPRTRLVSCAEGSCLQVTGRRPSAAAAVSINGHAVPVVGERKWRALVPVSTVREWSAPFARTVTVAIEEAEGTVEAEAELPIGLLGHDESLAYLLIRAK